MSSAAGHIRQCTAKAKDLTADGEKVYKTLSSGEDVVNAVLDPSGKVIRRRCHKFAVKGLTVCEIHGGGSKHSKEAAKQRWRESIEYSADRALERVIEALDAAELPISEISKLAKIAFDERSKLPSNAADPAAALVEAITEAAEAWKDKASE